MPNEFCFLVNALCEIQEECMKHDACDECPLHDPENLTQCKVVNSLPYQWDIPIVGKVVH